MMVINNKYEFGDVVYVATDMEGTPGIVVALRIEPGGSILYLVSKDAHTAFFHEFELASKKDTLKDFF